MSFQWFDIVENEHVITERLVHYVNTYGVNTRDHLGFGLHIHLQNMTKEQLKFVFSHDWDFRTKQGDVYYAGIFIKHPVYLFKMLLKHDHHGRYLTEGCYDHRKNMSLWTHLNNYKQYCLRMYMDRKRYKEDYKKWYDIISQQVDLLSNHKNKKMALFDMMLPWLDKSDKKRRF